MKQLGIALLSGLIGALIAAFLSYKVRLRAKREEDLDARRRTAHVHFLSLTNTVAADHFLSDFSKRLLKLVPLKVEPGFDEAHAIAALLAPKLQALSKEELEQVRLIAKPYISSAAEGIQQVDVATSDLGHMTEVTIHAYHRYEIAVSRLKVAVELLDTLLEKGEAKAFDAKVLHGFYRTYRDHANAAGILRAAFRVSAGVSDDYAFKCLMRSFEATKADVQASFSNNSKLALAGKAFEAARATSAGASPENAVGV